jgi:hypothetical protein
MLERMDHAYSNSQNDGLNDEEYVCNDRMLTECYLTFATSENSKGLPYYTSERFNKTDHIYL